MRVLLKSLFFIVILVVAGLIALPFFIDPNDYKEEISEQVENATGRKLLLEGDIELSVFPWLALELGPLALSNAKGFKAESFLKVETTQIRIKLLPLLSKKLEMDAIILDGLELNLETNKAGKTNWQDLASQAEKTDTSESVESDTSDDSPALAAINIAGIQLSNANIIWSDESKSEHYQLANFNLEIDSLEPNKESNVDMSFDLISQKPKAKAHISLAANILLDMEQQHYQVSNLKLSTEAEGEEIPFEMASLTLSADIDADMVKQLIAIDKLSLSVNTKKDQQTLEANLSTNASINLASQENTLKDFNLTANITDPALPSGKVELNVTSDISVNTQQQIASLSNLIISAQDMLIKGDINVTKLLSAKPNVAGTINVDAFNLRQLANNMAIELPDMADDSTLELVALTTEFTASSSHFNAKKLVVNLDQSKLDGQFSVTNFSNPALKFNLNLDQIDADRYLSAATEEQAATAPAESTSASTTEQPLPLDALRQLNAVGTLDIGKLKISGMNSEKIHININANKGLIKLSPMSANLYQGNYKGSVNLDARGKSLKLSINENLSNVQAEPLLKDLSGEAKLSGTTNAKVILSGSGATVTQIKKTLTGHGNFSFKNGAVKGINIAESIRKAKAALSGKKLAASNEPVQTDFASLTGSFTAKNGIISNQDLQVMSPFLRINGAGNIDLPKEGIDYKIKVAIVGTSTGQAGKELDDLKGLSIPVKITGTFSNPKPSVDLASMLKEQATAEVKEKVADKLKDELGGELGGLVGGLLGSDKESSTSDSKDSEPAKKQSTEDKAKEALKNFF